MITFTESSGCVYKDLKIKCKNYECEICEEVDMSALSVKKYILRCVDCKKKFEHYTRRNPTNKKYCDDCKRIRYKARQDIYRRNVK